jgi:hypothetical protein
MNLQSLVVVILRLMALDFLLQVLLQVTPEVLHLMRAYDALSTGTSGMSRPFVVVGSCWWALY